MSESLSGVFGFLVFLFYGVLIVNGDNLCKTLGNNLMEIGSTWKNENGCTCHCLSVSNYTFSQCEVCSKRPNISQPKDSNRCFSNGWTYKTGERWLSGAEKCSLCQCTGENIVTCSSTKHCSNPCLEGQKPQFGPCCEILDCKGNATIIQEAKDCTIDGFLLYHRKSVTKRLHCKDQFCTCNNGAVQCFEYCELSHNNSHEYWNKFCCPRKIGNQTCHTSLYGIMNPGESKFIEKDGLSCRCLDGEIYCEAGVNILSQPTMTSENNQTTMIMTTFLIEKNLISSSIYLGLPDNTTKELLVILCIFFIVIMVLFGIVFLIKIRYNHILKKRQRINRLFEDCPECDYQHINILDKI